MKRYRCSVGRVLRTDNVRRRRCGTSIYYWLKKNSELDAPGYTVLDRLNRIKWEEGTFIREIEEEMAKANAPKEAHACLSEERIRTIIREEMSEIIDGARKKACVPEYFDTEKMEDALVAIVNHLSETKMDDAVNSHYNDSHSEDQYGS
jgi:hypothetical protein